VAETVMLKKKNKNIANLKKTSMITLKKENCCKFKNIQSDATEGYYRNPNPNPKKKNNTSNLKKLNLGSL
jgi:hypothetical protein